jgi:hypothetical protein
MCPEEGKGKTDEDCEKYRLDFPNFINKFGSPGKGASTR